MIGPRLPAKDERLVEVDLARRSLALPVNVGARRFKRGVFEVTRALADGDEAAAARRIEALAEERDDWAQARGAAETTPALRALALCQILLDLFRAGWELTIEDRRIYALAPAAHAPGASLTPGELLAEKDRIRQLMKVRVLAQVKGPSCQRLRGEVEGQRQIEALLADGGGLAAALELRGAEAVRPYLQLARREDGVEETSGLELYSIFRYLRYTWSLPYGDTPGRTLPILIRDAGQPGDPVCGLLCLSSPVLRLTARDTRLGLTSAWLEAIAAGLDFDTPDPCEPRSSVKARLRQHLAALCDALDDQRRRWDVALRPPRILADLAALLKLEASSGVAPLAHHLSAKGPARRR